MTKGTKGLLGASLLSLVLQILVLAGTFPHLEIGIASNLLGVWLSLLAAMAAFAQARTINTYARRFWWLVASGFLLLTAANGMGVYYDNVLHASLNSLWPSDLLYFLFAAPLAMALFVGNRDHDRSVNWAQFFDFLQLGILAAALYLYCFYLPSHWRGQGAEMVRLLHASLAG